MIRSGTGGCARFRRPELTVGHLGNRGRMSAAGRSPPAIGLLSRVSDSRVGRCLFESR